MSKAEPRRIAEEIAKVIEIPDLAYEAAEKRYQDLGNWFGRPEAHCSKFKPHIYPQGSFRLGTVIRPLDDSETYDLDLGCSLEGGISKTSHTQEQLKTLVGMDVESYRVARGIQKAKKEKSRCWRLEYADHLSFYMDIVPCIPESQDERKLIKEAMIRVQSADQTLAQAIADLTVSITDNRHPRYSLPATDWNVSNPEGYARWFESRMRLAKGHLEKRLLEAKAAKVDDLPAFRWKTPLQRCVQLLKRHRDIMFAENPDSKPISIIITTLAARAYRGEADLQEALANILNTMGGLVNPHKPKVPNPVNPNEDFADKWDAPECREKRLEDNFRKWLQQAQADFRTITTSGDSDFVSEMASQKLHAPIKASDLRQSAVIGPAMVFTPKSHQIVETPARPWRR